EGPSPPLTVVGYPAVSRKRSFSVCLPPLQWQTYDAEFVAARFDDAGNLITPAEHTARLNGVLIHQQLRLTNGDQKKPDVANRSEEAPISLWSGHEPIYFRNIWVVPK